MRSKTEKKNYEKAVTVMQTLSIIFIIGMVIGMAFFIKKFNISLTNIDEISSYIHGGTLTVCAIIIVFTVVKAFALIFPPTVIFAVAGLIIDNVWLALGVNTVAVALSVILPYYFGRFAGKGLLENLEKRFPKLKKLDAYAGKNEFIFVYSIKSIGLIPTDLLSVIYGAMNISFPKYFIASNLAMVHFNVLFTVLFNKFDLDTIISWISNLF